MNEASVSQNYQAQLPKYVKAKDGSIRRVDKLSFKDRSILTDRLIKEQKENEQKNIERRIQEIEVRP